MNATRVFNSNSFYLVEIDQVKPIGNMGTNTTTWNWEISIVVADNIYKGMAIERTRDITIPWITLQETDLLNEMIHLCQAQTEK